MNFYSIGSALALVLVSPAARAQTDGNAVAQIPTAAAAPAATATSPDGSLVVAIALDNDGRATYAVTRKGKPVLAASKLGVMFTDAPKIERNLTLIGQSKASGDSNWTPCADQAEATVSSSSGPMSTPAVSRSLRPTA